MNKQGFSRGNAWVMGVAGIPNKRVERGVEAAWMLRDGKRLGTNRESC
jgi:hypothetical protein